MLVDRVVEHDPTGRLVAIKNVTGSEEFFQGHFPGRPVMPGVLVMECLAQAASIWLLTESGEPGAADVRLVGIDRAKFRRPVLPGDRLNLEVQIERRHGALVRASGQVTVANQRVAEGCLLLHVGGPRGVRAPPNPDPPCGPGRSRRWSGRWPKTGPAPTPGEAHVRPRPSRSAMDSVVAVVLVASLGRGVCRDRLGGGSRRVGRLDSNGRGIP